MGGKSSKQKIKKNKAAKGEQTQNSKEPKESTENGATATGKPSQNETTTEEHEDTDAMKDVAKNENTTESVEKKTEKELSQQVTATGSTAVSSETTPVDPQPTVETNSPNSEEKHKAETPVEDSAKEKIAETEAEKLASKEVVEELVKSECQEKVCLQVPATERDGSEAEASNDPAEGLHESCQKTEGGAEGESIPAPSSHTPETGTATDTAVGAEETTPQDKGTPATVPIEFTWEAGGETVLLSGSYDGWQEKIALTKCGDIFTKTLDVPVGEHLYRFCVDEQWVINRNLRVKCDVDGLEKNVLLVLPPS